MTGRMAPSGEGDGQTGGRLRIDPRFAERWVRVRREQGRRRLRILAGVLAAVVVFALAVGSLFSPLLNVRHIRVSAPAAISRAQVLSVAGLTHPRPLTEINTGAVAARLDAVPGWGAARVRKSWPETLLISVVARSPVAVVARANPAGTRPPAGEPAWATVDATGRVLANVSTASRLPVLQGTGPVPPPGGWLTGSAGPHAAPPSGLASRPLADLNAAADSPAAPSGTAAGLAIVAALPRALHGNVLSVTVGPDSRLALSVVPASSPGGSIAVDLGDGSQLAAKLTALTAMLTQANLAGVSGIDLTVPDRPAALTAR
jgi:hypothetical protein